MALMRDEFVQLLKDPSAAAARTGRFVCFTEDLCVEVMWDAIESALQPLQSPRLEPEGELGFENESRELEWFTGPLTLGEP